MTDNPNAITTVQITVEAREMLREIAKDEDRSMTAQLQRMIKQAYNERKMFSQPARGESSLK